MLKENEMWKQERHRTEELSEKESSMEEKQDMYIFIYFEKMEDEVF